MFSHVFRHQLPSCKYIYIAKGKIKGITILADFEEDSSSTVASE